MSGAGRGLYGQSVSGIGGATGGPLSRGGRTHDLLRSGSAAGSANNIARGGGGGGSGGFGSSPKP